MKSETELKRNIVCFAFLEVLSVSRNDKETYAYFRGLREGITFALTGQMSKQNQETLITCASQIDLDKAVEQFEKELAAGKSFVE